jgi:hypothetical protein
MATQQHAVRLVRSDLANVNWLYFGGYRFRIEAVEAVGEGFIGPDGLPDCNIFVYQCREASPYMGVIAPDDFATVAGPAQMADLPPLEPRRDRGYPFYRLSFVEFDVTSQAEADRIWALISEQRNRLCQFLDIAPELAVTADEWGPFIPDLTSQSES